MIGQITFTNNTKCRLSGIVFLRELFIVWPKCKYETYRNASPKDTQHPNQLQEIPSRLPYEDDLT